MTLINTDKTARAKGTVVEMNDKAGRAITAAQWVCACFPAINLALFLLLALHARRGLGHWPEPMVESYSTPLFDAHDMLVAYMWLFSLYGALSLWIVLAAINFRKFRAKTAFIGLACYLMSWAMALLMWWADPGQFVSWFLD